MPKRIIDGEALRRSNKLLKIESERVRAFYPWFITTALANGVCECDARQIFLGLAMQFPSLTLEEVDEILNIYEKSGLLFRWRDVDGTNWGYWTGIHAPGLLPAVSRLETGHYSVGPEPPEDLFRKYCVTHAIRTNGHGPGATPEQRKSEDEMRRQLSEKVKRLAREKDVQNELNIGRGPQDNPKK